MYSSLPEPIIKGTEDTPKKYRTNDKPAWGGRQIGQCTKHIPRGEIWLGHGLFKELGWQDDLESHLRLCRELAMDIIFLPVSTSLSNNHLCHYRYFSLDEVRRSVAISHGLRVSVVVDGPFERLSRKMGLHSLLYQWRRRGVLEILREEANQTSQVVLACLECKPDALVIADDIAYHHSTFVNPKDLEQSVFVFYRDWVQEAHSQSVPIFFHSCGNLTGTLQELLACGFDGIAGCELECQDVPTLKLQYESRLVFLTGIPTNLLEEEKLGPGHQKRFIELLENLALRGNFVLGSSCGLSSAKHLSRLRTLYQWADEAWRARYA